MIVKIRVKFIRYALTIETNLWKLIPDQSFTKPCNLKGALVWVPASSQERKSCAVLTCSHYVLLHCVNAYLMWGVATTRARTRKLLLDH